MALFYLVQFVCPHMWIKLWNVDNSVNKCGYLLISVDTLIRYPHLIYIYQQPNRSIQNLALVLQYVVLKG